MLEVLASASGGVSLTEVAQKSGLAYSTTYRILETLRRRRFVYQNEGTGAYGIGLKAFQVGAAFSARRQWQQVAHPAMKALVGEINETVSLGILDGHEAVYIHRVEPTQMMRMLIQVGATAPLHGTSVGKTLLAWRSEQEVRDLVGAGPFEAFTSATITHFDDLIAELRSVSEQGYAVDDGEREVGVRCVGAPIRDGGGTVIAALAAAGPAARLDNERLPVVAGQLGQAARMIEANLL